MIATGISWPEPSLEENGIGWAYFYESGQLSTALRYCLEGVLYSVKAIRRPHRYTNRKPLKVR